MTQDELDILADSCWEEHNGLNTFNHVKFAALVAAHEKKFWMEQIEVECNEAVLAEREACAKVCGDYDSRTWMEHRFNMADEIAAAIRARGEK